MRPKTSFGQKIALLLLGLVLFLIVLETGLRLGGFLFLRLQEHNNLVSLKERGAFRIVCLGESTTAEGGVHAYPSQLEGILNQRNIGIRFSVINKGVRATNTSVILSELEDNIIKYKADMVITMMGINDSGRHMPYDAPAHSRVISYFRSLKVYTLSRYLWMHLEARLKELSFSDYTLPACYAKGNDKDAFIVSAEKEIARDPHAATPYVTLGNYYRDIKQEYPEAETVYKRALSLIPGSVQLNLELARLYRNQTAYDPAVQYYRKVLALDPGNKRAFVELGRFYRDQLKSIEAQELLNRAIKVNPEHDGAYRELAWFYAEREDYTRAEDLYKKAIELDPKNAYNYIECGRFYYNAHRKDYAQAEACFKKAIAIDPAEDGGSAYRELGRLSREWKKYAQAEECFKNAIALNPRDDLAYVGLALTYAEEGKKELSVQLQKKAQILRNNFYNLLTVQNYRAIKRVLDRHAIPLVCVQYPMRSIGPLREMLSDTTGVIFVDNERLFKNAVEKTSYNDYFVDMFGGDFGHRTPKGNRLLAENIANTIMKEYFHR